MSRSTFPREIKYIAEIPDAQEVTLIGSADGDFWADKVRNEGLYLHGPADRAKILVSTVRSKWMGVRFRELVISLFVSTEEVGRRHDGHFLVAGFNTSRFFSFCERVFFQTPYQHGQVEVNTGESTSFHLHKRTDTILHATTTRTNSGGPPREEGWEGAIFLPKTNPASEETGKQFYARITGATTKFPFSSSQDEFILHQSPLHPVFGWLKDTNFMPEEWHIRLHAHHARSKTV